MSHAGCGRRSEVPGGLPLAGTSGPSPLTLGLAGTSKNLPWSWPSPSTCPTSGARTYRCSSGSGIAESRPARVSLGDTGGQSGQVSGKMWRLSQLAWTGAGGEGPHGQGPLWEDILPPRVRKWGRWGVAARPLMSSHTKGAERADSWQTWSGSQPHPGGWGGGIPWGQAVPSLRGDQHHQGLPEIPENRKEARSRQRGGLTSSCSDPQVTLLPHGAGHPEGLYSP